MINWRQLPQLTTERKTLDDRTGRKRKREVISSGAFPGLKKAGSALLDALGAAQALDPLPDIPEATVKDLLRKASWPAEAPEPEAMTPELALQLIHLFMEHLRKYHKLLEASNERGAESEDPRVQERQDEMEERADHIGEVLEQWDGIDRRKPSEFLNDEFLSQLELCV